MGTITSKNQGLFSTRRIFLHFLLLRLSPTERATSWMLSFSAGPGAGLLAEDMAGVPAGAVLAGAGFDEAAGTLAGDAGVAGDALDVDGFSGTLFAGAGADALVAAPAAAGALAGAGETGAAEDVLGADDLVALVTGAGAAVLVAVPGAGFAAAAGVLAGAGDAEAEGDPAATF